jgi:hypothetical protein
MSQVPGIVASPCVRVAGEESAQGELVKHHEGEESTYTTKGYF